MKQQRTKCLVNQHQKRRCITVYATTVDLDTSTATITSRKVSRKEMEDIERRERECRRAWLAEMGLREGQTCYIPVPGPKGLR